MKKTFFRLMPKFIQTEMVRRSLDVSKSLDPDVQLKLAETKDEFEQAFRLVHDNYVREGFISEQPSRLRVIPQHQLPSTHVLIAKKGHEVIGTLTLVRECKMNLPLERAFDLSAIRSPGQRMAEITCLAVKKEYRRANGGVVFAHLMKLMHEFSIGYAGIDQLVVAVYPKDAVFYEGLLCFTAIDKTPVDYLGAPAIALHLNLKTALAPFKKAYAWRSPKHNLHRFFFQTQPSNSCFPTRHFCEINYPTLTKALARQFFADLEKSNVQSIYSAKKFQRNPRIEVSCQGELQFIHSGRKVQLQIMDVSADGLKVITTENLLLDKLYEGKIQISSRHSCQMSLKTRWSDGNGSYGMSLQTSDPIWSEFIGTVMKASGFAAETAKKAG